MPNYQERPTIKTYFETNDFPTQLEFEALIDSAVHVNDYRFELAVTSESVFVIPEGMNVYKIFVKANAQSGFSIGSAMGQTDILNTLGIGSGESEVYRIDIWADGSDRSIYLNATNCTVYLLLEPVKFFTNA